MAHFNKDTVSGSLGRVASRFTVSPAASSGRPELIAFLKAAYADQFNAAEYQDEKKVVERLEWARSLAWLCRENASGKIVGHFGITQVWLKYKDGYCPAAWGKDLIVLPEFRNLGIGPFLVASVLKEVEDKASIFLIAGVRDHVYTMYKKFGFADMGYISLYVRPNILFMRLLFHRPGKNEKVLIEKIARFDGSFDKLWETVSVPFGLIVRRDSAYLNWRFVDQPYWKYEIFKALRKESRKPAGYIVLREGKSRGLRTGVISDIFASENDQDTTAALIDFAVSSYAKRRDIAFIRCDILNKGVGRVLRRRGFIKMPPRERFMFTNVKQGLDESFFRDRDNWFLDYSDSDLDLSGQGGS